MKKKIIKIGNSAGIILPQNIQEEAGLKLGDNVGIEYNSVDQSILISKSADKKTSSITPEFYEWLKKFNKRYKNALTELAKK